MTRKIYIPVLILSLAAVACAVFAIFGQPEVAPRVEDDPPPRPSDPPMAETRRATGADLAQPIKGNSLRADLEQFRSLLKYEWILANLNGADFDSAIDSIAANADAGMTVAELSVRLQGVLAMGRDGHAGIGQFSDATVMVPGSRSDFIIDVTDRGYTAYRCESTDVKKFYPENRFFALKEGYPRLLAIDGVPVAKWVEAAEKYVSRGPASATRWRAMELLQDLPFLRGELNLPDTPTIRVRLATEDGKSTVDIDAPTIPFKAGFPHRQTHYPLTKSFCKVLDGNLGYLWIPDCFTIGCEVIAEGMPKVRDTRGLIVDLRDNGGGSLEILSSVFAYLLPPASPRRAVGEALHWRGDFRTNEPVVDAESQGLSAAGRKTVSEFQLKNRRDWQPPGSRTTESRTIFVARPEAEPDMFPYNAPHFPKTFAYAAPVVFLFNHRCFSSAEILLAAARDGVHATLVGNATTVGGGGSTKRFRLTHSGLDVNITCSVALRADGTLFDGRGVSPDVVTELDVDYYFGKRDRMLEKAVEVLKAKIGPQK